ncbi:MAG: DUF445 family protein [Epsilonproteobacteria bacterium]|nr:DUF445 family protein [Campylobacterota bacterium]
MSKGAVVNLIAIFLVILSFFLPEPLSKYLYFGGLFAFSGAITNKLAIYMIFNRVPYLYGSGVIELNFEKFKRAIKNMIMEQFFTKERLQKFLEEEYKEIDLSKVIEKIDYSLLFDSLKEAIMDSKFGQLINMVGGPSALEPLREEFNKKIKGALKKVVESKAFKEELEKQLSSSHLYDDVAKKIENIIESRLQELTPKMVKELVESLIKEHLEWLVVWGGVFGGLIGVISAIFV